MTFFQKPGANNPFDIDYAAIRTGVREAVGPEIQKPVTARLGHPITFAIDARLGVDTDTPGMVFIHDLSDGNEGVAFALNYGEFQLSTEQKIFGRHVLLRSPEPNNYILAGLNYERDAEYTTGVIVRPQASISLSQFDYGLLQPTNPPSMRAIISGALYSVDRTIYSHPTRLTENMTSNIPTSVNEAVAVLVQIDPESGELTYKVGVDVFSPLLEHTEAFADYYPQPDLGKQTVGWLKLVGGMTIIQQGTHILPGQEVIAYSGGGGGVIVEAEDGAPEYTANTIKVREGLIENPSSGIVTLNIAKPSYIFMQETIPIDTGTVAIDPHEWDVSAEQWQSGGMWDSGTPGVITPEANGIYDFYVYLEPTGLFSGNPTFRFVKVDNGSDEFPYIMAWGIGNFIYWYHARVYINDYQDQHFELRMDNSTGSVNIIFSVYITKISDL